MWFSRAKHLLRQLFRRRALDHDLDEEVASYYGILSDQGRACVDSDGPAQVKFNVRESRMSAPIDTIAQDLVYAARVLKKSPGFTFFAVLTIALGLGANAAIFSLVDGVLLKSIGYPEPERIVRLWEKPPRGTRNGIAGANYVDWARQVTLFETIAAFTGATMSYSGGAEPKSLRVGNVTARYFDVFRAKAIIGRTFAPDEDTQGKEHVAVLTHRLWTNAFGADRSIVGRPITLNGSAYIVIGVLAGSSEFDRGSSDLMIPLVFPPDVARDYHYLGAVARMKPGVTIAQVRTEMSAIAAGIAERYPAVKKNWGATVDLYLDMRAGPQLRLSLVILMWAVAAVLLIACANMANLLMARATLRSREIAMRMALGARRGRIIRMLLTESLLLSLCGAAIGIALGYALLQFIQNVLPPFYFPAEANIGMDGRVLGFLVTVSILTSVAFGLAPALQASRRDSAESLKEGGRGGSSGRGKLFMRHAFVAAQVAIAFVLLVGGGLLVRSFQRLMDVDPGYDTEGIVAAYLPLPMESTPTSAQLTQYIQTLLDSVRAEPGIKQAAVATGLPLRGWGDCMPFRLPAQDKRTDGCTGFKIVTPSYFETLGLRPIAGRVLNERDTASSPPVAVANQSFVRRVFPEGNPIGKRAFVEKILPGRRGLGSELSWEIVGVVGDEKGQGLAAINDEGLYASFYQTPVAGLGIVASGVGEGGAIIKSLQRGVWRFNKNQGLDRPMTVDQLKLESLGGRRVSTYLLGGFALLAMLLSCAGIYGVLSFVTARRTQELGIRAALGATRGDLIRMVIGGGATPVLAGIVIGIGGAAGLAQYIQAMLFNTSPLDPWNLALVSALFLAVALAACFIPAWRAARADPITALRQE